jgi:hypothetical protein
LVQACPMPVDTPVMTTDCMLGPALVRCPGSI